MLKLNGVINKTFGFEPYKVGNKIAWVKEIPAAEGAKIVFKKLPSGTILKKTVDYNNVTWQKQAFLSNGNEMQSYISNSYGSRTIHISNPKGNGIFAITKNYDYKNNKFNNTICDFKRTRLFPFIEKIKMHMGIK